MWFYHYMWFCHYVVTSVPVTLELSLHSDLLMRARLIRPGVCHFRWSGSFGVLCFTRVFLCFFRFQMDEILKEVHLDHLAKRFKDERIEPEYIISLSDEQLNRMGVTTIGDKIRLRDACKRQARAQPSTVSTVAQSVLVERMSLFNPRAEKREKVAKRTKSTLKAKRYTK